MAIFFNFSPTSNHLHPLQVENCGSNFRLVVDEMTMINSGSKGLKQNGVADAAAASVADFIAVVILCIFCEELIIKEIIN